MNSNDRNTIIIENDGFPDFEASENFHRKAVVDSSLLNNSYELGVGASERPDRPLFDGIKTFRLNPPEKITSLLQRERVNAPKYQL